MRKFAHLARKRRRSSLGFREERSRWRAKSGEYGDQELIGAVWRGDKSLNEAIEEIADREPWGKPGETALSFHDCASVLPLMNPREFTGLIEDIRKRGVLNPITFYEGKILDGRCRYLACQRLGIPCPTTEYTGNNPRGFVVSVNLLRQHYSEGQRAVIAARMAKGKPEMSLEEAADRCSTPQQLTEKTSHVMEHGADSDGAGIIARDLARTYLPPETPIYNQMCLSLYLLHEAIKKRCAVDAKEVEDPEQELKIMATTAEGMPDIQKGLVQIRLRAERGANRLLREMRKKREPITPRLPKPSSETSG